MVDGMNGHSKDDGSSGSSNHEKADNICRDFLRNVCRRGKRCKFKHPDDGVKGPMGVTPVKTELTFCHDYQNGHCSRNQCRFIHCTCEDEDYYLRSGDIPPHILDQAIRKGQLADVTLNGDVPICKDFLQGECSWRRGGQCKFRHLTQSEYEKEIYGNTRPPSDKYDSNLNQEQHGPPDPKRQRFDPKPDFPQDRDILRPMDDLGREILGREMGLHEYRDRDRERDRERDRRGLEEILLLRKQLDDMKKENTLLKKQISDLRATNEFLLDQVTTLRISKVTGGVTAVTVPTVSLASTIPVACTGTGVQTIATAHSAAPPQAPQTAPQQPLAPTLGTAVQVSLSQAPTLTAVSLSTMTMQPQVCCTTMSSMTMPPQICSATSMAPTMSPGIVPSIMPVQNMAAAMTMSGASGHLLSYPIMSQPTLRTQLQ